MQLRKLKKLNIKDIQHLCMHLHCTKNQLRYVETNIRRYYRSFLVSGRPINCSSNDLKVIQTDIKKLLDRILLPDYLHGGIKGHSPKTNAVSHVGKSAVLNFDIQKFFPSVTPHMVYMLFCDRLGCSPDVARILTQCTTYKWQLPQGAPSSTAIANLIIVPVAIRLKHLANHHHCDYTQFVDDGCFSGPVWIENLRPLIEKILRQSGFQASPKKEKRITYYRHEEQVVTGIKVNCRLDAKKEKINEIKKLLIGIKKEIQSRKTVNFRSASSVKGKIQYVSGLNPKQGRPLNQRMNAIISEAN